MGRDMVGSWEKGRNVDRGGGNQRGKETGARDQSRGRRGRGTHRRLQPALLVAGGRRLVAGDGDGEQRRSCGRGLGQGGHGMAVVLCGLGRVQKTSRYVSGGPRAVRPRRRPPPRLRRRPPSDPTPLAAATLICRPTGCIANRRRPAASRRVAEGGERHGLQEQLMTMPDSPESSPGAARPASIFSKVDYQVDLGLES
ncbi:uncharacterized protein LOC120699815 isoform X2 [Panicum virgatum]|uniref:uncharacterized protein LOC120699815 isoform X2 n=1 Tax=Panicum virgatum TaxID=38727 RepID=UPI0019D5AFFF|nr:uncharacterized protein LOC120699815 isoform X2 [Panicum virgatum]